MNNAMDIIKKNMFSVVCGVIAIIAVVAWFWPIGGMYDQLRSEVQASAKTYQEIENLRKQPRNLPSLVLENSTQDPLERFPNDRVIQIGRQATKALTDQSDRMLKTVSSLNIRPPLVPGSLPRANSKARSDFPRLYLEELGQTEEGWKTGIPKLLHATEPPTKDEIDEVAWKIWDEQYKVRIVAIAGQNNLQQISDEYVSEQINLAKNERIRRAKENLMYLDPDSIPPSPEIQAGKPPTDVQIWFAQTGLWIVQDVAAAINEANKDAHNVMDAPIKHLVSFRVPFGPEQYILASSAPQTAAMGGGESGVSAQPTLNANGVPEYYSLSPTGRVCNPVYDVIHFDLVLRVDFRKIPQILAEIERNRLFTVLRASVAAIDSAQELKTNGYVYGNEPVAELTIQGEALFLRSWTVDKDNTPPYKNALMPEFVRGVVGAQEGVGPAVPGNAGEMLAPFGGAGAVGPEGM